jgi:hypothetical protein
MGHEPVWRSASVGRYRYQPDRISRRRPIGGRYSERQGFCRWRRCGGGGPHDGGGSHGGGPGEPSWLRSCNVTFSPGRIFAMSGPHGAGGPHGTPLHLGTRSRHRRRAPRGALLHGGGTGKSVARCHRTVLAYWKFESISLQQRVCEPSAELAGARKARQLP